LEQAETSEVVFMVDRREWWETVDVAKLSEEARHRLLAYVVEKYGRKRVREEAGVSRVTLWRLLERKSPVKPEYVKPLLKLLSREEFEKLVTARERLRALGIVRDDGTIDYSLALEILAIAKDDEYLKNAILRFVVSEFREDLKRMLGISFAGITLKWDEGFEHFLAERKKRRKIRDPETLKYYRSIFKKYLEGRELSEELIDYVVNHPNKWLRNVFRHYIQYLYYRRMISPETFGWIMEVVPSRSYRLDVRPYPVELEDVRKTLEYLREHHMVYYAVYRIMLESGARFEHVLRMIELWNPDERVEIPGTSIVTERLICLEEQGFCRYYMGLREETKPCEWIYFSTETLGLLSRVAPRHINRHQVRKYAKRHNLVLPKYVRKVSWRLMVKAMSREAARFIQSRFGELRVSEARYEDLLGEADQQYPAYLELLLKTLYYATTRDKKTIF
jgi:intergrase/recombinase